MNINFEYYHIFYVVATVGNITKAARELMISQPAISKSIKNLEEQLGGTLFIRTKRGVVLTEEGKEFYSYIKQAMELISNGENKFSDLIHLDSGTLRIGISATLTKYFLIPYLKKFRELYPKIDIQICTNISSELISKLRNGSLDFLILNFPYPTLSDIHFEKIQDVHDCFVVGNDYKYLTKSPISFEELSIYPIICQTNGGVTRNFLNQFVLEHQFPFHPTMELTRFSLVVDFVKQGFGIGYVTEEFVQEEINRKELYLVDVVPKTPTRAIGIAYSKHNFPNFSTKKFIELIHQGISD